MQFSPLVLVLAASAGAFGIGQALLPTVRAEPIKAASRLSTDYRVQVESLHTKHTTSGMEITGKILNTGRQTLTYTSVVTVFTDASGQEIGHGDGYLAAGPVCPGQAAEFRANAPETPGVSGVTLRLSEAGHSVSVISQDPDKRQTTVW